MSWSSAADLPGLAEALAAGRAGARVMLVDDQPSLEPSSTLTSLRALPEVQLLSGATAFGIYEANCVMVTQAARLWQVRAKQVVVATGAHERPLVFADNDRPGVMLASAARTYAHRYGVAVGTRCVVFTNNDSAYDSAVDLAAAGIDVAAIVDLRPDAHRHTPMASRFCAARRSSAPTAIQRSRAFC